ncbi:hypothetical protein HYU92_06910 [Candidatus Curtissbacteria bacterium]|nr:hypothetical protein [Candidatus Curtissbacteria bacterium]
MSVQKESINGFGVEPSGRGWFHERHGVEDVPVPSPEKFTPAIFPASEIQDVSKPVVETTVEPDKSEDVPVVREGYSYRPDSPNKPVITERGFFNPTEKFPNGRLGV